MDTIKHAAIDRGETSRERAERLLDEIRDQLELGLRSREEGIALMAKLDIAAEAAQMTKDETLSSEAALIRADIKERYPEL